MSEIIYTIVDPVDSSRNGLLGSIPVTLNEFSITAEPITQTAITADRSVYQRTTVGMTEKVKFTVKGVGPDVVQVWDEFVRSQYMTSEYFTLDVSTLSPYYRNLTCYLINQIWEPRYRGRNLFDITREAFIVQ